MLEMLEQRKRIYEHFEYYSICLRIIYPSKNPSFQFRQVTKISQKYWNDVISFPGLMVIPLSHVRHKRSWNRYRILNQL